MMKGRRGEEMHGRPAEVMLHSPNSCYLPVFLWRDRALSQASRKRGVSQEALAEHTTDATRQPRTWLLLSLNWLCALVEAAA